MTSWEIYERVEEELGVKLRSLFVVRKGERPSSLVDPFKRGFWFFGIEGGDPGGKRLYQMASKVAEEEVERLNREAQFGEVVALPSSH